MVGEPTGEGAEEDAGKRQIVKDNTKGLRMSTGPDYMWVYILYYLQKNKKNRDGSSVNRHLRSCEKGQSALPGIPRVRAAVCYRNNAPFSRTHQVVTVINTYSFLVSPF